MECSHKEGGVHSEEEEECMLHGCSSLVYACEQAVVRPCRSMHTYMSAHDGRGMIAWQMALHVPYVAAAALPPPPCKVIEGYRPLSDGVIITTCMSVMSLAIHLHPMPYMHTVVCPR